MEQIQSQSIQIIKDTARQAAEQIINEMNIDQVIDTIYKLPAEIHHQETILSKIKQRLDEAKSNLELEKQVIIAAVISETNGDGKPRYTNEKAREAEIAKRLAVNTEYQEILLTVREAENAVNSEQFELNRLHNEFSAYKTIAKILTGKLQLMAGL